VGRQVVGSVRKLKAPWESLMLVSRRGREALKVWVDWNLVLMGMGFRWRLVGWKDTLVRLLWLTVCEKLDSSIVKESLSIKEASISGGS
jgi:hypothetical protein